MTATIGYTTDGGSSDDLDTNEAVCSTYSDTTTSTAYRVKEVKAHTNADNGLMKALLFSGSAGNFTLLTNGVSDQEAFSSIGTWLTFDFSTCPYLLGSTDYQVGVIGGGSSGISYDSGSSGDSYGETDNNYSSPASMAGASSSSNRLSVYCTYYITDAKKVGGVSIVPTGSATSASPDVGKVAGMSIETEVGKVAGVQHNY